MIEKYASTCTPEKCQISLQEPFEGYLKWDYGGAGFTMTQSCELNKNFKVCNVKTAVYYPFSEEGVDLRGWILETNKPVCFPPTCSEDQISILDPNPGKCNRGELECEIISYEVDCPERVISNSGSCKRDKLPDVHPFLISRGVPEAAIVADCVSMFTGSGTVGLCEATTGPSNNHFKTDFTGFENDSAYINYQSACAQSGGKLCHFDMKGTYKLAGDAVRSFFRDIVPIKYAADVEVYNEFTNFPRCIATECEEEDMEEVLAHHGNIAIFNNIGFPCNPNRDNCKIDITNIQCTSFDESTLAPFIESNTEITSPSENLAADDKSEQEEFGCDPSCIRRTDKSWMKKCNQWLKCQGCEICQFLLSPSAAPSGAPKL